MFSPSAIAMMEAAAATVQSDIQRSANWPNTVTKAQRDHGKARKKRKTEKAARRRNRPK